MTELYKRPRLAGFSSGARVLRKVSNHTHSLSVQEHLRLMLCTESGQRGLGIGLDLFSTIEQCLEQPLK